jgi:hypothetical protein
MLHRDYALCYGHKDTVSTYPANKKFERFAVIWTNCAHHAIHEYDRFCFWLIESN